jgi:hypothetical protein
VERPVRRPGAQAVLLVMSVVVLAALIAMAFAAWMARSV